MVSLVDVFVPVRPETDNFERDLKRKLDRVDGRRAGMSVGQSLGKGMRVSLFQSFGDVGKGITGAFAGLAAAKVFGGFIEDARESAKVGRQTEAVIKSMGGVAGISADQVGDLATAISNKTGIDDEAIQSAENLLLTFGKVRNEVGAGNDVFNQATKAAVDMAAALGTEPRQAALQLGKALNDPIKGITALTRAGVSFTAQQKTQITTLVNSGHTLEAQKLILGELQKQFGGAAEAAADPLQRLQVIAGNLGEDIGGLLLPVVERAAELFSEMAPRVSQLAGFIGDLPAPVKAAALTIGGLALAVKVLGPVATIPGKLADSFNKLVDAGGRAEVTGGRIATAGSRIGSAFKGALLSISPLSIAIGAAATIVGIYAAKKAQAAREVEDFTTAIQADSGALGENTRALVSQRLEQEGALQAAQLFGLNLEDVTSAALGNQDALTRINTVLDLYARSQEEAASSGDTANVTARESDQAYRTLKDTIGGTNAAVTQAADAAKRQTAATGPATTAIKEQGNAATTAAGQVKTLTTNIFDLVSANSDAATTDIAFRDSLTRLSQSVKDNGTSLSLNTQKGRDNRGAVIASIDAAQRHADAVFKQTGREDSARKAFERSIPQIREQARRLGLNKKQVDDLIASIAKLKPKTVPVTAPVTVVDKLSGGRVSVDLGGGRRRVVQTGRAFGGRIGGFSPSDRSDNVPIMATAGEFMIQRPTVRKIEQKAPGFLDALNAGAVDVGGDQGVMRASIGKRLRFAGGGSIPAIQSFVRGTDPLPYIWGGAGPGGYDCSGLVGAVYGKLTGRGGGSGQRYFTTDSIGASQGFRPGLGTFSVGVTPGRGHMAGQLGSLKFEARSTASGIHVGASATSPKSFARHFFLPQFGGTFGADALTAAQKHGIFQLIQPTLARELVRSLGGARTFDSGGALPPGVSLAMNGTGRPETVMTGKTMDAVVGELRALRRDLANLPVAQVDDRYVRRTQRYMNGRDPNGW